MGKNTKYIEVDQLNLAASRDRVLSNQSTMHYEPRLRDMDKKERRKEIWGMIIGLTLTFGPTLLFIFL